MSLYEHPLKMMEIMSVNICLIVCPMVNIISKQCAVQSYVTSTNNGFYSIMSKCINLANAAKHFIFCNSTPKIGSKRCFHTLLHRSGL